MAAPPKYPWDQLRKLYVEGWDDGHGGVHYPSVSELLERFLPTRLREDHVRRRSGREHWLDKRALHQAELERARREARSAEYLQLAENVDGSAIAVARNGLQLVQARVQEMMAVQGERLRQLGAGQLPGSAGAIDAMELTRLSLAGIRWHQLAMRAVGQEDARGGLGAAAGDATDLAAMVVTERERNLAATVGARVREAIDVASQEGARAPGPPPAEVRAPSPGPTHVLDQLFRANGNGAHHPPD
jgi:hypothetical protein